MLYVYIIFYLKVVVILWRYFLPWAFIFFNEYPGPIP